MQEVFVHVHGFALHCRNIGNIRGFSRKILVAVVADIELREDVIIDNMTFHPSTLVLELQMVLNAFSVFRDSIGKDFALKEVVILSLYDF